MPRNNGEPPRYTAMVARVYPYSLRPILLLTSLLGMIYAFVIAVGAIRSRTTEFTSNKLQIFNIITAIFYFAVGAVEVYGFIAGILQKVSFAKPLLILAPAGILLSLAGQIMNVVVHFAAKDDLISRCVQQNVGTMYTDGAGRSQIVTDQQATDLCNSSWNNGNWTVFAWFIVVVVLSLLFGSIAISYYRQLVDPSLIRTRQGWFQRTSQPPQSYQMQPGQYYPPPPQQNQSWMVPPYPGPPQEGFEKGDYHPSAPWAQSEPLSYNPSSGAPPVNRAEEEAWARAEREGVTASSANGATPARSQAAGYIVRNDEEDEAWERAKAGGVTAHITGAGKRTDGEV